MRASFGAISAALAQLAGGRGAAQLEACAVSSLMLALQRSVSLLAQQPRAQEEIEIEIEEEAPPPKRRRRAVRPAEPDVSAGAELRAMQAAGAGRVPVWQLMAAGDPFDEIMAACDGGEQTQAGPPPPPPPVSVSISPGCTPRCTPGGTVVLQAQRPPCVPPQKGPWTAAPPPAQGTLAGGGWRTVRRLAKED